MDLDEGNAARLRVALHDVAGARVVDCGVAAAGGLTAGMWLAETCLDGRADLTLVPGEFGPSVQVWSDDPVRACLGSQYAGWQIAVGKFFAMGSGPMRALYGKEAVFDHLPDCRSVAKPVGVLESRKLPPAEVVEYLAGKLYVPPPELTLLVAPTASVAGTVQIVARALETALHKLHELKFDVTAVTSGYGVAPLPPVAADDLTGIGRTNDAILYGGRVELWGRFDDAAIAETGPRVPASASPDYGAPFAEVFERAGRDFYKIDPLLFSPAVVTFHNLATGRSQAFGRTDAAVLRKSFGG